jgi:hypothetical protein
VYPYGAAVHVPSAVAPSACSHTSQGPAHAELQQCPSTQKPLAHALLAPHACPWTSVHWPDALHVFEPVHESGSWRSVTTVHVPMLVATLHIWQVPHCGDVQHTPSTQLPLAQVVPPSQAWPGHEAPLQHTPSTHDPSPHSPHPPSWSQWVARSHGEPLAFAGWHVPFDAQ